MFILQIPSDRFYAITALEFENRTPAEYTNMKEAFFRVTGREYSWSDSIDSVREVAFESEEEMVLFKLRWL